MSWEAKIIPGSPVWVGVTEYADARIAELTAMCVDPTTSTEAWRAAQAGIAELSRLKRLPDTLRTNDEITKAGAGRRGGNY